MVETSFAGTLIRFRVLGIPVRVEAGLLVTTLILGASRLRSAESFATWLCVVFVSILVHELGHALVGRRFGLTPDIRLYGWGGLTSWTAGEPPSRARSLLISLAGPAVGIALGVACHLAKAAAPPDAARIQGVLGDFVWASGIWGAVNLAPVLPLDGGNALQAVLGMIAPARAEQGARLVSAIAGLAAGAFAFVYGQPLTAVFAAWLGVDSARRFVEARREARDEPLIARCAPAFSAAIDADDGESVAAIAEQALREARTDRGRTWIVENLAVGRAMAGSIAQAVAALSLSPPSAPPSARIEGFIVRTAVAGRKSELAAAAGADVETVLLGTSPGARDDEDVWARAASLLQEQSEAEIDAVHFARAREAAEILGRDRDAARLGEALLERAPDPDLAFVVACAWARAGEAGHAAELAERAAALGFRDWERAAEAPDPARRALERARRMLEG